MVLDTRESTNAMGGNQVDSGKIGCTAQTLNEWVKKAEVDNGRRAGVPTDFAAKLKALERENWELRQANEILARRPLILLRRSSTAG